MLFGDALERLAVVCVHDDEIVESVEPRVTDLLSSVFVGIAVIDENVLCPSVGRFAGMPAASATAFDVEVEVGVQGFGAQDMLGDG